MGDLGPPPASLSPSEPDPLRLRILTHNIRYATTSPFKHELPWPQRAPTFLSHLHYHVQPLSQPNATLICLQEVLHAQLLDISSSLTSLSQHWTHLGVGRDDGCTKGEYAPIFYDSSAWELRHFETVWLNESGAVGRRGWDAASVRIVSCAVLETRALARVRGKRVLVLNTHLDDQGQLSRRESAKVILRTLRRLRGQYLDVGEGDFWVLAGDLNSEVSGEEDAYGVLGARSSGLVDSLDCVTGHPNEETRVRRYGETSTFTGFNGSGDGEGLKRIDFVFVGVDDEREPDEQRKLAKRREVVKGYAVLPNRFEDGIVMSDHRAVVVDLVI